MGRIPPDRLPEAAGRPEDKHVPRPEEYLGQIIESTHQVESILAVGSKFVVFKLRNLKTSEVDRVMKVWRVEFDPKRPLLKALPEALANLSRDPDRVIRICDRLLALDSSIEAAAFDKGVALLAKRDPSAALAAFNLAVSLQPRDILNLVHRASCFARLERDDECLRDLQAAAEVDPEQVKKALAVVRPHAAVIRQALRRLAKIPLSRGKARQALRAHFGPAVQLRMLFSRFF